MFDRDVPLSLAASAFVWFVGAGVVIADLFLPDVDIGSLGIMLCCGGAVLMIHSMLSQAVAHLERTAFVLGRDAGREEARVPIQHRIH